MVLEWDGFLLLFAGVYCFFHRVYISLFFLVVVCTFLFAALHAVTHFHVVVFHSFTFAVLTATFRLQSIKGYQMNYASLYLRFEKEE